MPAGASGWHAVWASRGLRAALLWPVSLCYGTLTTLRTAGYAQGWLHSEQVAVPVIVVGNVVAGGAGKTPLVLALARHFAERGVRIGIVSRGYGRRSDGCREVTATSLPAEVGDEPALLHRTARVPVFVARRRADAARALLAAHPDTQLIVCDDGLQHLALARDIGICIFDDRGTGNGWLLPAGPLREPWPRAVDFVLRSPGAPVPAGNAPMFDAPRALAAHAVRADGTSVSLVALLGTPLVAVAGIARPDRFFAMLRDAGLALSDTVALPDHYDFDSWSRFTHAGYSLICTEKDALKLWRHRPDALAVPLVCTPDPAFWPALDARLAPLLASRG